MHVRVKRHGLRRLGDLSDAALTDLASALDAVIGRYDGLWGFELPYLMCVQEAPDGIDDWHLHVEMLPPHRNQTRLKVRASVETALGVFINDTLPEANAEALAAVLSTQGYESRILESGERGGACVELGNCPFDALAKRHTALVCGLNRHFVQGVVDGLGTEGAEARLEPTDGRCCVTVHVA